MFKIEYFSPASLALVLLGCILIFRGPRSWILPTFLAVTMFISLLPHVVIFGMTFMVHRILLTCAWLRMFSAGEHRELNSSPMDKALVYFSVWTLVGECLLFASGPVNIIIYQTANAIYDGLGTYFLCRMLLKNAEDFRRIIAGLAWICMGLAFFMMLEFVTHRNFLSMLGALHETVQVREGKLRCQASFSVPITAGTFGAVLFPLFAACWFQDGPLKKYAIRGCIATTIITVATSSGGPMLSLAAAMVGLAFWGLRDRMRAVRWTTWITLTTLHLTMKAPVWALISRIKVVPGNSGFHRFQVIDAFIRQFPVWWMLGVKSTDNWGGLLEDVANQYCVVAKHGGLLSLILFVRIIVIGFRQVGMYRLEAADRPTEILIWSVGVMLWAHCVSFLGISYFDQTKVLWFLSLAMLASLPLLTQPQEQPATAEEDGDVPVNAGAPA